MIAKAGLGLIGLGAISIGGVAVTKPHLLGMDYMPEYKVLSQEQSFSSSYTSPKFGNKYGKYLASSEKDNKSWWDWAYRRLSKEKIKTGKFTNKGEENAIKVSDAYAEKKDGNGAKALNQVCKAAFEANESDVKDNNEQSDTYYKKSEVWKYCSPVGQKPTTVKEFDNKTDASSFYKAGTGGKNPIGKEAETELISVNDNNNQVFWDIRDKEFKVQDLSTNETNHMFFKELKGKNKHIKDICAEAYKQEKNDNSSSDKATTEETKKFCSLTIA